MNGILLLSHPTVSYSIVNHFIIVIHSTVNHPDVNHKNILRTTSCRHLIREERTAGLDNRHLPLDFQICSFFNTSISGGFHSIPNLIPQGSGRSKEAQLHVASNSLFSQSNSFIFLLPPGYQPMVLH